VQLSSKLFGVAFTKLNEASWQAYSRRGEPSKVAEKADINPYSREYETAMRYLLNHGCIEQYQNAAVTALELYRVTNKGLEEIISHP
jgi:hypothetical protein